MLNTVDDPEIGLALSYAPLDARGPLAALWALDARLGLMLRQSNDPMIGQLRLTWWHDALTRMGSTVLPAEPVLRAINAQVLPLGIVGRELARMVDGWEVLLDSGALTDAALDQYAHARGALLFKLSSVLLGGDAGARLRLAGEGWALVDLARHVRDPAMARAALATARVRLDGAFAERWPYAQRSLGAITALARQDAHRGSAALAPAGSPRRVARMFWHRLSGR